MKTTATFEKTNLNVILAVISFIVTLLIGLAIFSFVYFNSVFKNDPHFGQYGDLFAGIVGPFVSFGSGLLAFFALKAQIDVNIKQQEQIDAINKNSILDKIINLIGLKNKNVLNRIFEITDAREKHTIKYTGSRYLEKVNFDFDNIPFRVNLLSPNNKEVCFKYQVIYWRFLMSNDVDGNFKDSELHLEQKMIDNIISDLRSWFGKYNSKVIFHLLSHYALIYKYFTTIDNEDSKNEILIFISSNLSWEERKFLSNLTGFHVNQVVVRNFISKIISVDNDPLSITN